jgi:hypothetical protein
VQSFFVFIALIGWRVYRANEEEQVSQPIAVFLDDVQRRPTHQSEARPYIRRKTLIVAQETGEGWHPIKADLGDYSASGIEDGVQTIVVLKCHWTSSGNYSNGGSAEEHVCDGNVIDIADSQAAVKFVDFDVYGPGPPKSISRTPGSKEGEKGGFAYEAAAQLKPSWTEDKSRIVDTMAPSENVGYSETFHFDGLPMRVLWPGRRFNRVGQALESPT